MRSHDQEKLLRVKEAAEILGVSPNTVRAWGAAGKIPEYRHPANGYRLYRKSELVKFLQGIKGSEE
jgi:excisionase family DNA binding protein